MLEGATCNSGLWTHSLSTCIETAHSKVPHSLAILLCNTITSISISLSS